MQPCISFKGLLNIVLFTLVHHLLHFCITTPYMSTRFEQSTVIGLEEINLWNVIAILNGRIYPNLIIATPQRR